MTKTYVFDTEAIIAFLYNEPGHDVVAELLAEVFQGDAEGRLTEANASEIFYLIARFEGEDGEPTNNSLREADRDIRALERRGLTITQTDWRLAGDVKADGDISLGDANAVALAHDNAATLVAGADDDFDDLPIDIDLLRFRDSDV